MTNIQNVTQKIGYIWDTFWMWSQNTSGTPLGAYSEWNLHVPLRVQGGPSAGYIENVTSL